MAKITPVDESGKEISETYFGYIYPTLIAPNYYPFYSVLCKKQVKPFTDSAQQIDEIKEELLTPMNEKMSELSSSLKDLSEVFVEKTTEAPEIESESSGEGSREDLGDSSDTPVISVEGHVDKDDKKPLKEKPLDEKQSNAQSGVFQCEGVTCPTETQTCKISESAIEPSYEEILKTVFCLSSTKEVLLKSEVKTTNPNKGSSLNSSRSLSRHPAFPDMKLKMKAIESDFKNQYKNVWKDFDKKMSSTFKQKAIN